MAYFLWDSEDVKEQRLRDAGYKPLSEQIPETSNQEMQMEILKAAMTRGRDPFALPGVQRPKDGMDILTLKEAMRRREIEEHKRKRRLGMRHGSMKGPDDFEEDDTPTNYTGEVFSFADLKITSKKKPAD